MKRINISNIFTFIGILMMGLGLWFLMSVTNGEPDEDIAAEQENGYRYEEQYENYYYNDIQDSENSPYGN